MKKLVEVTIDLFWILFPLFVILVGATWVDGYDKIAEHPDIMLLACVFFGESAWKARHLTKLETSDRNSMELLGFLGFAFSMMAAFVLVVHTYGKEPSWFAIFNHPTFWRSTTFLWLSSVLYAGFVRWKAMAPPIHELTN